jgi:energy-coupling factor transporter transmembrane protein EcfT
MKKVETILTVIGVLFIVVVFTLIVDRIAESFHLEMVDLGILGFKGLFFVTAVGGLVYWVVMIFNIKFGKILRVIFWSIWAILLLFMLCVFVFFAQIVVFPDGFRTSEINISRSKYESTIDRLQKEIQVKNEQLRGLKEDTQNLNEELEAEKNRIYNSNYLNNKIVESQLNKYRNNNYSGVFRIFQSDGNILLEGRLNNGEPREIWTYYKNGRVKYREKYVTRTVGANCCDGSTSNATGRGACSHHGGVCSWAVEYYSIRL